MNTKKETAQAIDCYIEQNKFSDYSLLIIDKITGNTIEFDCEVNSISAFLKWIYDVEQGNLYACMKFVKLNSIRKTTYASLNMLIESSAKERKIIPLSINADKVNKKYIVNMSLFTISDYYKDKIGYKPYNQKLELNFPVEYYKNGIHRITNEQYKYFNFLNEEKKKYSYTRGIFALKYDDIYMFISKSSSRLYLMFGEKNQKLEINDMQYFYSNLKKYYNQIMNYTVPYKKLLKNISEEIKKFGGLGIIHSNAVSISANSHIYINSADGKFSLYWKSKDTPSNLIYSNIEELIAIKEKYLFNKFMKEKENLPLINNYLKAGKDFSEFLLAPKFIYYNYSLQYDCKHYVIRMWNSKVLNSDFSEIIQQNFCHS